MGKRLEKFGMNSKKHLIMQANIVSKNNVLFTEECLYNILKDTYRVRITECFTKKLIGFAINPKLENGNFYMDLEINEKELIPKHIYPCISILIKKQKKKENHIEIQKGILKNIGMCDGNANENIPPIILEKSNDK